MESLTIKSSEGTRWVQFSDAEPPSFPSDEYTPPFDYFVTTLVVEGLRASLRVYGWGADSAVRALEEMARDWRGWKGTKEWESIEGDFALSATHDGLGHINLTVKLRSYLDSEWEAEGVLRLEAGSLDRIAADAQSFFRPTPTPGRSQVRGVFVTPPNAWGRTVLLPRAR